MPGNKTSSNARQHLVAEKKLVEGKTFREIGKELGISKDTACQDMKKVIHDNTYSDMIEQLKVLSLANAVQGTEVEGNYLCQVQGKDGMSSQEAMAASSIANSNQKRYSFLQGQNADSKGGEVISAEKAELIDNLLNRGGKY